ncbi:MAG: HDIG domain-containing protein, partial [Chloroflexota bacterium]|nr:HDIG domain-containing protein [Chloroflexota bacterium]
FFPSTTLFLHQQEPISKSGPRHVAPMSNDETKIINFRPPRRHAVASWRRLIALATFVLGLLVVAVLALNWQLVPGNAPLAAGAAAPDTLRAPRRVTFISQTRTRIARDQAAVQVATVYDYDSNLLRQLRGRAADLLRSISAIRADYGVAQEQLRQQISRLEPGLSPISVDTALQLSEEEWQAVNAETLRILDENVRERVRVEELAQKRSAMLGQMPPTLSPTQQVLTADLVSLFVRPNVLVNGAETERARREARDRVQPVQVTVERGETVVRQGDVITADDVERLEALGLGTRATNWQSAFGLGLYAAVLVLLLGVYLHAFHTDLLDRPRSLLLIGILLAVVLVAMKLIVPGRPWAAYGFPVAVVTVLISNLISTRLAVLLSAFIGLLAAPILGFSVDMISLFIVQGMVGALAARRIERLNGFFLVGLQVALANLAVSLSFRLINVDYDVPGMATFAVSAIANGLLTAILTMGTFSLAGPAFGLTTMLQLLELAHPGQPLLRRLLTEAPGTYHHSIVVGNLAERAAEQIGVDSLLVRVGAYFHDVGKLHRPYYFAENQFDGDNVHDRLRPEASAQALIDHVVMGVELAKQYGLPPAVQRFIPEHHGTRLASFFYRKAVKMAGTGAVDESMFRYPGPRPRSKETALVMLADTVEASVRAASNRATKSLEELVERAVNERILEGELDDCNLTLKDLEIIKRSFMRQLQGVYHPRIQYPDPHELEPAQPFMQNVAEPS